MLPSRRWFATSGHWVAVATRRCVHGLEEFTLPAPKVIVRPMLWIYVGGRSLLWWVRRVFIAEPLFKAYCTSHGRRVRTDIHIPYVKGKGSLHVGDDVLIDGPIAITFAARFSENPTLRFGNATRVGSSCSFVVGKSITLGEHVRLARGVQFRDSGGHASDPAARLAGAPPADDEVRPIIIEDNVWIGTQAMVMPGTHIGEGCIVAARAVVSGKVPAYTVVAGAPARRIAKLEAPPDAETASQYLQ